MKTYTIQRKEIEEEHEVILLSKKDPAQFKIIYERYFKCIFLFIYRKTGDKELTADLVSQVFVNALSKLENYQYKGVPFSAWLYRIADNEVAQYYRRSNKVRWVTIDDSMIENICEESNGPDPEELKKNLDNIIQTLSPEEVRLLELRFFENKTYKDISFIVGMTETGVKTKVWRLLEKIRLKIYVNEKK